MEENQNQGDDQGNVLPTSEQNKNYLPYTPSKKKYSTLSVFMAVILFGIVVMLGERVIFDLNRFINPAIDKAYTETANQNSSSVRRGYEASSLKLPSDGIQRLSESNGVSPNTRIYYKASEKGRYMMWKLVIHSAVIIPIFVLAFVLFYFKKKDNQMLPLLVSFMFFAFWMMFHLLGETVTFVMDEYRNIAIYVILVVLAAVFGVLVYYTQIKFHKKEKEDQA